ncbi:MAG: D-tyrosyl-tRNA(Tyr) deacylase [Deltaproteobacteria bacterium]|nr:D-tyrosyl-tRNA(Tyr) deacylase [Deltaproteobacteria bacterium]
MRAVVQRVSQAEVRIAGHAVGKIGSGLCVLLGAGRGDTTEDVLYLVDKVVNLRVFADEEGKMNRSLLEAGGALLVVSQFTLFGDARKGRRPSFVDAMAPAEAEILYERFLGGAQQAGVAQVEAGRFGAMMDVELVNHGPVTLLLDSRRAF